MNGFMLDSIHPPHIFRFFFFLIIHFSWWCPLIFSKLRTHLNIRYKQNFSDLSFYFISDLIFLLETGRKHLLSLYLSGVNFSPWATPMTPQRQSRFQTYSRWCSKPKEPARTILLTLLSKRTWSSVWCATQRNGKPLNSNVLGDSQNITACPKLKKSCHQIENLSHCD